MKASHFQDGRNAYLYLRGTCQSAVDQLQLYDMDSEWTSIDLLSDVGVNENSMSSVLAACDRRSFAALTSRPRSFRFLINFPVLFGHREAGARSGEDSLPVAFLPNSIGTIT